MEHHIVVVLEHFVTLVDWLIRVALMMASSVNYYHQYFGARHRFARRYAIHRLMFFCSNAFRSNQMVFAVAVADAADVDVDADIVSFVVLTEYQALMDQQTVFEVLVVVLCDAYTLVFATKNHRSSDNCYLVYLLIMILMMKLYRPMWPIE